MIFCLVVDFLACSAAAFSSSSFFSSSQVVPSLLPQFLQAYLWYTPLSKSQLLNFSYALSSSLTLMPNLSIISLSSIQGAQCSTKRFYSLTSACRELNGHRMTDLVEEFLRRPCAESAPIECSVNSVFKSLGLLSSCSFSLAFCRMQVNSFLIKFFSYSSKMFTVSSVSSNQG